MALANRQTDLHALNNFSSSTVEVSLKKKQHVSGPCSFGGEVVHVEADVYAHATERQHNVS